MKRFNLDKDTFAPELENWLVWVDGESTNRRAGSRSGALRIVRELRKGGVKGTIRMKAIGVGTPF